MGRIVLGTLVILAALLGLKQFSQRGESDDSIGKGDELIAFISHGEPVEIAPTLPEEGYAIVEFTADW